MSTTIVLLHAQILPQDPPLPPPDVCILGWDPVRCQLRWFQHKEAVGANFVVLFHNLFGKAKDNRAQSDLFWRKQGLKQNLV